MEHVRTTRRSSRRSTRGVRRLRDRALSRSLLAARRCSAVVGGRPPASARSAADGHGRHPADRERLPARLGIKKGFFEQQGHRDQEDHRSRAATTSCSRWRTTTATSATSAGCRRSSPARTGIPITAVAASEVEGTSSADNWQNILVKGIELDPHARRTSPGKTIAVNALKGVGEVMIRAALEKQRRRPELDQAPRDPVPGDADGAEQRPGRRDLDARAVPVAGPEPSTAPGS